MSRILGGKQGGRRRGQTFYPQYRPGASLPEIVRQVMRMFERRSLPLLSSAGSARAESSSSEQVPVGSMVRSLASRRGSRPAYWTYRTDCRRHTRAGREHSWHESP